MEKIYYVKAIHTMVSGDTYEVRGNDRFDAYLKVKQYHESGKTIDPKALGISPRGKVQNEPSMEYDVEPAEPEVENNSEKSESNKNANVDEMVQIAESMFEDGTISVEDKEIMIQNIVKRSKQEG
jgi:hypothetical protein